LKAVEKAQITNKQTNKRSGVDGKARRGEVRRGGRRVRRRKERKDPLIGTLIKRFAKWAGERVDG